MWCVADGVPQDHFRAREVLWAVVGPHQTHEGRALRVSEETLLPAGVDSDR